MVQFERKKVLYGVLALVLAIMAGPINIPLPGMPTVKVPQVKISFWQDDPRPLEGALAPNTALRGAVKLFNGSVLQSETVFPRDDGQEISIIDRHGAIFTAVFNYDAPGDYELLGPATIKLPAAGRALGFRKDADENLVVAHTGGGLVRVEPGQGEGGPDRVVVLASHVSPCSPIDPGSPIRFANDLAISRTTGVVYFTDSSALPPPLAWPKGGKPYVDVVRGFLHTLAAVSVTGRLLAYYPSNGTTHVLAKGFWYANGIVLSQDESYLVFTETLHFRVLRFWLTGEHAGKTDTLIDHLPGFPDGVGTALDGGFWVTLPVKREKSFELLKLKALRSLVPWLPFEVPLPKWGAVLKVSPDGQILKFLCDPDGSHVGYVTSVAEARAPGGGTGSGTRLYLGSIVEQYVAYIDV